MAEAEVGDDVFGEDPTVARLEARVAELLGKETGLFIPSGVMGNQIAVSVHTSPGDEVVVAERSHIFHYESGAAAHVSGVQLRPVGNATGILQPDEVDSVVRGAFDWEPRTTLVCLENTVNKSGGRIYPLETIMAVAATVRSHDLSFHLDGARLWNAAVALNISEKELSAPFDSVSVCLSKGLGAPVGSVLVGTQDFITEARRMRKRLGGGMRQAGILAAAGLVSLSHRDKLAEDHGRASLFASAIDSGSRLSASKPETNIVLIETGTTGADAVISTLSDKEVKLSRFGPTTARATFHRDVGDDQLAYAVEAIQAIYG